ncbi:PDZ domain-containing protein [Winogradskyella maritima]|uniref:M61 family metallopeptidase n=1 Tax=Winogradskyella maritima TaxID=1517766 RepID=A0ABV8AD86_9FLAO|nr:PDZ domain-containing protein [Winogradskyella maritima]
MKKLLLLVFTLVCFGCNDKSKSTSNTSKAESGSGDSQYSISFDNLAHHEANINITFSGLPSGHAEIRMPRSSPGRYAIHEFAKNVYNVKFTDAEGNALEAERPDPYSWAVKNHDGTVNVSYTLYANRADGTYSQIDETHAHLNMPATFMYAPSLANNDFKITFNLPEGLNWKVATQLKPLEDNTFMAEDLQYFMDSPTEISDHMVREFDVDGQTIKFALHHNGTAEEFDQYISDTEKIVLQQKVIFEELPKFDYGVYTFLGCYMPNVSGDGMEHRNSTILTSTRSLANGGQKRNLGTVSHEFFHCWNVERIRPASLEPFDFTKANMSGELWFAEGFTSYYDDLTMTRAGITSQEDYIKSLTGTFNYVWNFPGRQFFNPIEMSYQAPFVDAATAVDDINRNNTFISYYSYGSMLGLALDLSLREKGLNLDDYMKLVWETYGKPFKPYTVSDLHETLNTYAGKDFGDAFFNSYIYKSEMPDFQRLFKTVGVAMETDENKPAFGMRLRNNQIVSNTAIGSSAYDAGLEKGDKILKIDDVTISETSDVNTILNNGYKPQDTLKIIFERFGKTKETTLVLKSDPSYQIIPMTELSEDMTKNRASWLGKK